MNTENASEDILVADNPSSSQGPQTYQSSPMAFAVNAVSPVAEQVQTANVETEEEKDGSKVVRFTEPSNEFLSGSNRPCYHIKMCQ